MKRATNGFCKKGKTAAAAAATPNADNAVGNPENEEMNEIEECCVHQMYIDFKDTYGWEFIMNLTESWCDPKIFDREFRLEVQCPCFVPKMRSNNNIY